MILDVAVGVRPSRCARMTIEHALMNLSKLSNRLEAADVALRLSSEAKSPNNLFGKGTINQNNDEDDKEDAEDSKFHTTHAQCVEVQKR